MKNRLDTTLRNQQNIEDDDDGPPKLNPGIQADVLRI